MAAIEPGNLHEALYGAPGHYHVHEKLADDYAQACITKQASYHCFLICSLPTCCKMLSTSSRRLFDYLALLAHTSYARVATGRFGAGMQLSLVNDGPVTFWLQV